MQKLALCMVSTLLFLSHAIAFKGKDSLAAEVEMQVKRMDSVESSLKWETGNVTIGDGLATVKITDGFKFLNAEQSRYILHDLWGNPPRPDVLGMIFPAKGGPYADSSFAFVVSYEADGYVKDDDADKIDYDDMFKDLKKSEPESNRERAKAGYDPIYMINWAAKPFYDKSNRVLHWAKELKFGDNAAENTLNYDVRVLGRKGVLSLNAIANMSELSLVKANIDRVLKMPEFTSGNKYSDFNSNTDKVAEYGIGAIVAGTILAKTGVLALIAKFLVAGWKFILLGLVAAGGAIKKIFTKKKQDQFKDIA